jgi:hypothetical protein
MLHQKLKIVNKRRISQSEIRNSAAAEKNWNRKARAGKNSFPPTPFLFARPSDWILKFGIRILLKKSSNINQKTPPIFTFCEIVRNSLGAKRLGMVFFRNFEGIFEIARQRAVDNAKVRTNLFEKIPNPFGIFLLSVFFGLVGFF